MAVVTTTGTVDNIKFGDDYGFVTIIDAADGLSEIFVLWFLNVTSDGPIALYTMLLSLAAARNLTVEISHDDNSPLIRQVRLRA